jgi:hypothetical protein
MVFIFGKLVGLHHQIPAILLFFSNKQNKNLLFVLYHFSNFSILENLLKSHVPFIIAISVLS